MEPLSKTFVLAFATFRIHGTELRPSDERAQRWYRFDRRRSWFVEGDVSAAYSIVRIPKQKVDVEIGSGMSTRVLHWAPYVDSSPYVFAGSGNVVIIMNEPLPGLPSGVLVSLPIGLDVDRDFDNRSARRRPATAGLRISA